MPSGGRVPRAIAQAGASKDRGRGSCSAPPAATTRARFRRIAPPREGSPEARSACRFTVNARSWDFARTSAAAPCWPASRLTRARDQLVDVAGAPARSREPRVAATPRSAALNSANEPRNFPIGFDRSNDRYPFHAVPARFGACLDAGEARSRGRPSAPPACRRSRFQPEMRLHLSPCARSVSGRGSRRPSRSAPRSVPARGSRPRPFRSGARAPRPAGPH